jgi:hypothetical protein
MINISFDGRKLFDWEGTSAELANVEQEVEQLARLHDQDHQELAEAMAFHMAHQRGFIPREAGGLEVSPQELEEGRAVQMAVVLWWLLEKPTTHPDHPGKFRDYIDVWDFDFNLVSTPNGLKVEVAGAFGGTGVA